MESGICMAWPFLRNHRTANIVIKDHVIRFVSNVKASSPFQVKEYGEKYLPNGIIREGKIIDHETLQLLLEECIEDWGIQKRKIRFLVPDPFIVIRKIKIPEDLVEDEIKGYLYLELGSTIHLPFENPVFDFHYIGEKDGKKEILLFAAPEQVVHEYNQVLEDCNLDPIVADISPLSIYRLYAKLQQPEGEVHEMVVQFDLQMVNISIFHNHKPVFMRHLTMDLDYDLWEFSKEANEIKWTGEPEEVTRQLEDMYNEIERVLNFYRFSVLQGKGGVTKILLSGDHPQYSSIYERFKGRFDQEICSIRDEDIQNESKETLPHKYHLAFGLALKEVK